MKKALLPHISLGFWGQRQKEHGLWVVSCITLTQVANLQVVAGRGPVFTTHWQSGFKYPLPCPLYVIVFTAHSPDPPLNLPVFWQKQQVMGDRVCRVLQQSVVHDVFETISASQPMKSQLTKLRTRKATNIAADDLNILFINCLEDLQLTIPLRPLNLLFNFICQTMLSKIHVLFKIFKNYGYNFEQNQNCKLVTQFIIKQYIYI